MVDRIPAKYGNEAEYFTLQSTCMEVSVSLLFVHEPPYQTTVVCCSLFVIAVDVDHCTAFHVRVGLA